MNKKEKILTAISSLVLIAILGYFGVFKNLESFVQIKKQPALVLDIEKEKLPEKEITLLSKVELSYLGSTPERIQNIKLAVGRIDGTIVKANQEFSFNKALGTVSLSDGFKEAKTFLNGEVLLGVGGGICQVSTILFESLVKAGLPITERHNHTFSVPYYNVGLDATVSSLGPDLKFINDTENDIKIKGYTTQDNKAVFEIYGINDKRIVSIGKAQIFDATSLPQTRYVETFDKNKDGICENTSQIGYTAKVIYDVSYQNGNKRQQVFDSIYKPLARTCYLYTDPVTMCNVQTLYSRITGMKCSQ